ncbi:MAG: winged helix-turn-helix transcriptional regulator [Granulosicoccus sp.]|nr:winged helix-turn-helix transcriptional regulator [Granulosicoccus sp.]
MSRNLQPAFRALGDPTRRAILRQLCQGELTITEVVEKFDLTRTAVRKHLTVLEEGKLITVTPRGKERVTRLNRAGLKSTADWFNYFDKYWDDALDSLKNAIENDNQKKQKRKKK